MPKKSEHAGNSSLEECGRRRLAEGSVAAVDECDCGMLQLHLGALTLRLTPPALADLWDTLGRALRTAKEDAPAEPAETLESARPFLGGRRGDA
jgi:hypothetical protein